MSNNQKYFQYANQEYWKNVEGKSTKKLFKLREFVYGVLVPDYEHPLSCVSVSNSSLSIDLWTGCAWQCRYCHVQGTVEDLVDDGKMLKKPQRRNSFTIDEIIDELIKHPFFIPHETVISIGTASTEPFAFGEVANSTFELMLAFIRRGMRNPFWIVTKNGVPKGRQEEISLITQATKVMISICWADNPNEIEPVSNDRFKYVKEAKKSGATISWYMRPLVLEWGANKQHIEQMMSYVSANYRDCIDMIVPGGLRWTEGIENGIVEIHGLSLPEIPRNDNIKSLPSEIFEFILSLGSNLFPNVPIYKNSSCALTKMLSVPSITSVQNLNSVECQQSSCSESQRKICESHLIEKLNIQQVQFILDKLGIPAKVISFDPVNGIKTEPDFNGFTYAIRNTVIKHLSLGV
jgi:DNA repair photolyase